jgi:hypothetical protein
MDNATNNDTMVAAFERRYTEKGFTFSKDDARMRCMPHTIHLSALKVRVDFYIDVVGQLFVYYQLLEAIGALTKDEKNTAESKSRGMYQEAATESVRKEADEAATAMDDGTDAEAETPTSLISRAVFKVFPTILCPNIY